MRAPHASTTSLPRTVIPYTVLPTTVFPPTVRPTTVFPPTVPPPTFPPLTVRPRTASFTLDFTRMPAVTATRHAAGTASTQGATVRDTSSALLAAAHRLATATPATDLVDASSVAAAASASRLEASDFLEAAASAAAVGRAESADASTRPGGASVGRAVTDAERSTASVRNAHVAARSKAAAVGRRAAEDSMVAIRRAASRATASGGGEEARRNVGAAAPGDGLSGRGRLAGQGALEATLHNAVDVHLERGRPRAVAPIRPYMPPVPLQVLQSTETTREALQHLCSERGIPFGAENSGASLKVSLVRNNAYTRTT